jgi:phosphate/sulfate permease
LLLDLSSSAHEGLLPPLIDAAAIAGAGVFGIPVSTTHTITGAIVGSVQRGKLSAVRSKGASNIMVAWIITLPASALNRIAGDHPVCQGCQSRCSSAAGVVLISHP